MHHDLSKFENQWNLSFKQDVKESFETFFITQNSYRNNQSGNKREVHCNSIFEDSFNVVETLSDLDQGKDE